MKTIRIILFMLFAAFITASAQDFQAVNDDGVTIYYNIIDPDEKTVEVTNRYPECYSGDVVIPTTVENEGQTYHVITIGDNAFYNCIGLTSVTIPESVTTIGHSSFSYCTGLTSVNIPTSVTSIGFCAFNYSGIYNDASNWENHALYIDNCLISVVSENLSNYTIKDGTRLIGSWAFYRCNNLTSIEIPESVTTIGTSVDGESSIKEVICNASTPPAITEYTFNAWRVLFTIPSESIDLYMQDEVWSRFIYSHNVYKIDNIYYKKISENAVALITDRNAPDSNYRGDIVIPATVEIDGQTYNVTSIGDYAFFECNGIKSVTIPNSVTAIGDEAFYNCKGLSSIDIPNSVTSIGNYTFGLCSGFTSVNIPNSVTSMGSGVFYRCYDLTSVTIPESVTSISIGMFEYCYNLTSVNIPNSVSTIGDYAFYECHSLTSIEIPNSVTTIGENAFACCVGLTSVTIPNSVTSIAKGTFTYCWGLTSVSIPNSVTTIGGHAFIECYGLTSVNIPESVTSIGYGAFAFCYELASINIPNSVISIGAGAFYDCNALTSVTIPNSVTTIGYEAFADCSGLTEVTVINNNPTNIALGVDPFMNAPVELCTLYVPKGSEELYATADVWKEFGTIVGDENIDSVETIMQDNTAEVLYYDLNGYSVAKPQPGNIYIKVVNGVASKILF